MYSKVCVSILLFGGGVDAARVARSNRSDDALISGEAGTVGNLYTFGCPQVSKGRLMNPGTNDGCFPGVRVVSKKEDGWLDDFDIVPGLLTVADYQHVNMKTMFLDDQGKIEEKSCSWDWPVVGTPSIAQHMADVYAEKARKISYLEPSAVLGLLNSYNLNQAEVAQKVSAFGWGLVGSAVVGEEVSYLMQNPADNRCLVTFEGSDNFNDWLMNVQIEPTSFCGLAQQVHVGFTKAAMEIVATSAFNDQIKSNLGNCNGVDITGHSLGGAIAALFTACANNRGWNAEASEEWKHFTWTRGTPKTMSYL